MLAFTSVYFLESRFFKGLRAFGVKNSSHPPPHVYEVLRQSLLMHFSHISEFHIRADPPSTIIRPLKYILHLIWIFEKELSKNLSVNANAQLNRRQGPALERGSAGQPQSVDGVRCTTNVRQIREERRRADSAGFQRCWMR
jgi:hypothetical protein